MLESIENTSEDSIQAKIKHKNGFKGHEETDEDGYPTVEEWLAMPDQEKLNVVHDSLLELYLNIKI